MEDIPISVKMSEPSFAGIEDLANGKRIDEKQIEDLCDFINLRLDCADFRMVTILRTYLSYYDLLSEETRVKMKSTILNFKYWMDEGGADSMCYWSENHQIIFFTCGYIAGKYFKDETFFSNKKGYEMEKIFEKRIIEWMQYRFDHGFTEWHSNTYYEEDIPPLTLLIDFADTKLSRMATIIMDLFVADLALHCYKGLFSVTSGRCYEEQKRVPLKQDTLQIIEYLFGKRYLEKYDYSRISTNLLLSTYQVPEILVKIANDTSESIIKTSMGHNLEELATLRNNYSDNAIDYLQWAMEAFSNPEVISNTLKMYNKYGMKHNIFLNDFEMLNKPILRPFVKPIAIILNPYTNGVAIQKVNSYTYKTKDFILSNAQNYQPKMFGDQQHIWQLTIDGNLSIFSTHPGVSAFDDNARSISPTYWVGNGINPDSYQHENKLLCVYDLRTRKGFMEPERQEFTHLHFPKEQFDKVVVKDKYLFGQKGEVCVGIITKEKIEYNDIEAIQHGKVTAWVCEVAVEDFETFIKRIESENIEFSDNNIKYTDLELIYNNCFKVDGKIVNIEYDLLESKFGNNKRNSEEIIYEYEDEKLTLNLRGGERKYETNV